jgi:hypothetical protein
MNNNDMIISSLFLIIMTQIKCTFLVAMLLVANFIFAGQVLAQGHVGNGGSGGSGSGSGEGHGTGGEEGEEPVQGNNLSFPAIATDGYVITPIASSSFTTAYEGPYVGLSEDELAVLDGYTWYAQKTEGNTWQADYVTATSGTPIAIYGIDWGDNIESVNPIVGNPFRIEVGLYQKNESTMLGYKMALLANPSSPDEVQGTDGSVYDSELAAVVSGKADLVIQNITNICTQDLEWSGDSWMLHGVSLDQDSVMFAAELNVGGKYVYGASQGGWRPLSEGAYRITMYLPDSDISLTNAIIGNYNDWLDSAASTEEEESGVATPTIDTLHNLTYIDVFAAPTGGGKPGDPGTDSYDPCATVIDDNPATTTDPVVTDEDVSSESSGGGSSSRKSAPKGEVAGISTSQFVTQLDIDLQRHVLIDSVNLLSVEYAKLLTLIASSSTEQAVIDLQKVVVQNQIQLVRNEYSNLLKMMLIVKLQELVAKFQALKQQ